MKLPIFIGSPDRGEKVQPCEPPTTAALSPNFGRPGALLPITMVIVFVYTSIFFLGKGSWLSSNAQSRRDSTLSWKTRPSLLRTAMASSQRDCLGGSRWVTGGGLTMEDAMPSPF